MNRSPKRAATAQSCLESCEGRDGCGLKQPQFVKDCVAGVGHHWGKAKLCQSIAMHREDG